MKRICNGYSLFSSCYDFAAVNSETGVPGTNNVTDETDETNIGDSTIIVYPRINSVILDESDITGKADIMNTHLARFLSACCFG